MNSSLIDALRLAETGDHMQLFFDGFGRIVRLSSPCHRGSIWPLGLSLGIPAPEDPNGTIIHTFLWDEDLYGNGGLATLASIVARINRTKETVQQYVHNWEFRVVLPKSIDSRSGYTSWGRGVRLSEQRHYFREAEPSRRILVGHLYFHAICYVQNLPKRNSVF